MKANIDKISIKDDIGDIVSYINILLDKAIGLKSSDIHIEPTKNFVLVRFRVDGDLILIDKIDNSIYPTLITRIKIMAALKIDESRIPQDGKISYKSEKTGEELDIRVSLLPINIGEKVVLRLLRQDNSILDLNKLGFIEGNLTKIKEALKSNYGIILVAGPTGSGKSTTLFSLLKHFNPIEKNISTLEDPVEYDIEYINQSQIYPNKGFTFASGLRSLLRQDPDIIMVGETRDKETATLSIEAALTGHLVLSTIHTNSAAGTIQRLINMDIEPFLIASALKMVISQRLIKKLCSCKEKMDVDENLKEKIKKILYNIGDVDIENLNFYKPCGCDKCNGTGYKGRIGVHEILSMGTHLEKLILSKASEREIDNKARENGMISIEQDALIKAIMGETSLEEVFKLN